MELNSLYKKDSFFLIAGPCVIENESNPFEIAEYLVKVCRELSIPLVFKASYKKANRSSSSSFTGIGDEKALTVLKQISEQFKIPVITDIHSAEEAKIASNYVNMLQIPAFLCRQSELLEAAGKTGLPVNIKKGQFLSAESMKFAAEKVEKTGNKNVLLTERGSFFGYEDLVVDFRSVPIMKNLGYPVIVDCTHSLQKPNQNKGVTGGKPEFIGLMMRNAIVSGASGLFIETHPDPSKALSDGANMLKLDMIKNLLEQSLRIFRAL